MNLTKRTLLAATMALSMSPLAALAQGADGTVAGIDISLTKGADSTPVMQFSLNRDEVEKFNTLKGAERADFLARIMTRYIIDLDPKSEPDEIDAMLLKQMGGKWCGPCRMAEDTISGTYSLDNDGISVWFSAEF